MWYSFAVNLLDVTLQKNPSSGSHKVPLTENRAVGVIILRHDFRGGGRFIASAAERRKP